MIWKQQVTVEFLNKTLIANTLNQSLGIEIFEIGADFLTARMPVDARNVQPHRLLHGGASAALAETVGSVAAFMCLPDVQKQQIVGIEINANHLSSAREGTVVFGTARPLRIGRTLHVWNIEVRDEKEKLICVSRLTVAVVSRQM
jgi:1,4-dihydroxy-2-naphthoyl-CoA hydrolase